MSEHDDDVVASAAAIARVDAHTAVALVDDYDALDDAGKDEVAAVYERFGMLQVIGMVGTGVVALGASALFPPALVLAIPALFIGNQLIDHRTVKALEEHGLAPQLARDVVYEPYKNAKALAQGTAALFALSARSRRARLRDSITTALAAKKEKRAKKERKQRKPPAP